MKSALFLALAAFAMAGAVPAQTTTTKVIFISADLTRVSDFMIKSYLESRYGKANVTYQATEPAGSVKPETIRGYDVAVLSSTPSSGRYRNILDSATTPIVNMEEAMCRNANGEFRVTNGRTKEFENGHTITITTAHPITAGYTVNQNVKILSGTNDEVWWDTGPRAAGAVVMAADDDTATNGYITAVEAGAMLMDNTPAPCRRVMFGMTDHTFTNFTADGLKLFGQSVDWAAGACCAQASNYGAGLAGTNGIPTLTTSAEPKFGTTINVLGGNSIGVTTTGMLLVGSQQIDVPFLGGSLLVNPSLQVFLPVPPSGLSIPVTIPDLSALCGVAPATLRFQVQLLQLDAGATAGVSMTPGMQLRTGKY